MLTYKLVSRLLNRQPGLSLTKQKQLSFKKAKKDARYRKAKLTNNPEPENDKESQPSKFLKNGGRHSSKIDVEELESLLYTKIDHEELIRFISHLLEYSQTLFGVKDILKVNKQLAKVIMEFKTRHHEYLSARKEVHKSLTELHNQLIYFKLSPDCLKQVVPDNGLIKIPRLANQWDGLNLPKGYLLEPVLGLVDKLLKQGLEDYNSGKPVLTDVPPLLSRYFIYFNYEFRGKISNSVFYLRSLKYNHLDEKQRLEVKETPPTTGSADVPSLGGTDSTNMAQVNLDYLILKKLLMFAAESNLETGNALYFNQPNILDGFKIFVPVYKMDECVVNVNLTTKISKRIQSALQLRRSVICEGTSSEFQSKTIMTACAKLGQTIQEIRSLIADYTKNSPVLMTSTRLLSVFFQMHIELDLEQAFKELSDFRRSVYRHETELVREVAASKRVFEFGFDTSKRNYQKIVAYLSAEPETFHKIMYATANIEKTLGFKPEEVLGADLDAILPRPIRNFHRDICHPRASNSVFIAPGTEFNFFVRNCRQEILPCLAWVRISPNLDNGLALVGLLSVQVKTDQTNDTVRRVILSPNHTIMEMCEGAKNWFDYEKNITEYSEMLGECLQVYERAIEFRYRTNFQKIEDLFGTDFSLSDYEDYVALSEGVMLKLKIKDGSFKVVCVKIKHVKTRRTDQLVLVPEFIESSDKNRFRSAQELHFVQKMLHSIHFGSFDTQKYDWRRSGAKRPEQCVASLVGLMGRVRNLQDIDENAELFQRLNMIPELSKTYTKPSFGTFQLGTSKYASSGGEVLAQTHMKHTPNSLIGNTFSPQKQSQGFNFQSTDGRAKRAPKVNLIANIMKQVNPNFEEAFESAKKQDPKTYYGGEMDPYSETDMRDMESSIAPTDPERFNGQSINKDSRFKSPKRVAQNHQEEQSNGAAGVTLSSNNLPFTSIRLGGKKASKNSDYSDSDGSKPFNRSLIVKGSVNDNSAPHISNFGLEFHSNLEKKLRTHKERLSFHNDSPQEHYVIDQLSDKSSKKRRTNFTGKPPTVAELNEHQQLLQELAGNKIRDGRLAGFSSDEQRPGMVLSTDENLMRKRGSSGEKRSSNLPLKESDTRRRIESGQQSYLTPFSSNGVVSNSDSSKKVSNGGAISDSVKDLALLGGAPTETRSAFIMKAPKLPLKNQQSGEDELLHPNDLAILGDFEHQLSLGGGEQNIFLANSTQLIPPPDMPTSTFLPAQPGAPATADDLKVKVTFGSAGVLEKPVEEVKRVILVSRLNIKELEQPSFAKVQGSRFVQDRMEEESPKSFVFHPEGEDEQKAKEKEEENDKEQEEVNRLQFQARFLNGLVNRRKRWAFQTIQGKNITLPQIVKLEIEQKRQNSPKLGRAFTRMMTQSPSKLPIPQPLESPRRRLKLKEVIVESSSEECKSLSQKFEFENIVAFEDRETTQNEVLRKSSNFEKNYSSYVNLPLSTFRLCRYLAAVIFVTIFSFIILFMIGIAKTSTQQVNYLFLKDNLIFFDQFTWGHYEIVTRTTMIELALGVKSGDIPADIFSKYFSTDLMEGILIAELTTPELKYTRTSALSPYRLKKAVENSTVASGDALEDFKPWLRDKKIYTPRTFQELRTSPIPFSPPDQYLGTINELMMLWINYANYFETVMKDFRYKDFQQLNEQALWLHMLRMNGVDRLTEENLKFVSLATDFLKYKIRRVVNTFKYLVIPEQVLGVFVLGTIVALFYRVYKYFSQSLETLFKFSRTGLEAELAQLAVWTKLVDLMVYRDEALFQNVGKVFPVGSLSGYNLHERSSGEIGSSWALGQKNQIPISFGMTSSMPQTPYTFKNKMEAKGGKKHIMSGWKEFSLAETDKILQRDKQTKRSLDSSKKQKSNMSKYTSVALNSKLFGLINTLSIPLFIYLVFGIVLIIPNMNNAREAAIIENQVNVVLLSVQAYNSILLASGSLWYALVLNDTVKIGAQTPSQFFINSKRELLEVSNALSIYRGKDLGGLTDFYNKLTSSFKICEDYDIEDPSFYLPKFENCTSSPGAVLNTDLLTYIQLTSAMIAEISSTHLQPATKRGIEGFLDAMKDTTFSLFFTYSTFLFYDLWFYTLIGKFTGEMERYLAARTPTSGLVQDSQSEFLQIYLPLYAVAAGAVCLSLGVKVKKILKEFLLSYKLISIRLMHHNQALIHFVHREIKQLQQSPE